VSGWLSAAEPRPVSVAAYTVYMPGSLINQPPVPADKKIEPYIASAGCNTVGDGAVQYRANGSHRFAPPPSFATTIANPSPFSALASTIAGVDETFFSLSSTTTGSRNSNRGSRCTRSSRV
jgi:hypothetical protein